MAILYRHLKPNGDVFYIGIGKNEKRAYNKNNGRSNYWKNIINKYHNYEVDILKRDLTWEDACELEKILISYYGRKDLGLGNLVNMTDGGDGTNGMIHPNPPMKGKFHTNKTKILISNSKKGKFIKYNEGVNEIRKEKIKQANLGKIRTEKFKIDVGLRFKGNTNRKGKKNSQQSKDKISKIILDYQTGIFYNSLKEASLLYGYSNSFLSNMINGIYKNKTSLIYV